MDVKFEKESQNSPVIIKSLADYPGGLTLDASEVISTAVPAGAIVALGADGLAHLFKTAKVQDAVTNTETSIPVYKGHEFKVGDVIAVSGLTGAGRAITDIDTSDEDIDTVTVADTLGVVLADGSVLVQAAAVAASNPVAKYAPLGVTVNEAVLEFGNQGVGITIIAVVNAQTVPYAINADVKALLPDIKFIY